MDCREVNKLLAQYIESDLGKDVSAIIKEHLLSCGECSAGLAYLKRYKKELASLKKLKAPADFLEELNLRMEKRPKISKIIKALFIPLKIKLPIEAFGVLVTVIVIVLIFNPVEQVKKSMRVEHKQIYVKADRKPDRAPQKAIVTYEIALALRQSAQEPLAAYENKLKDSLDSGPALPQAESAGPDLSEKMHDKSAAVRLNEGRLDGYAKLERAAEAEKAPALKPGITKEDTGYRSAPVGNPIEQIKEITVSLKGKVVKEDFVKKAGSKYVTVEIPAQNQKAFMNGLSRLGILQGRESLPDKKSKGYVRLKIHLLNSQ